MYTSDIKSFRQKCGRTALIYGGIAVFCVVFCLIYEQFSFGEHSDYMRRMFLLPLLGGTAPFSVMSASGRVREISRAAYNLWNSGIAVWMSGCLVHGIIEISGRICDYDLFYGLTGGAFLTAAIAAQALSRYGHRRRAPSAVVMIK